MKTKYKILTASLMIGFLSTTSTMAQAAWEVNDAGLRTDMQKLLSGLNSTIEAGNNLTNLQLKQNEMYQQTTDARFRRALGDMKTIDDDISYMPSIQKCVEMTRARAAFGGGNGGNRTATAVGSAGAMATVGQQFAVQQELTRTKNAAVAKIIQGKNELGTCVGTIKINGCSADGTHPGADADVISLIANVDTTKAKNVPTISAGSEGQTKVLTAANVSIDKKGLDISSSVVQRLIGIMPEKLTANQAKEASSYQAMWEILKTRASSVSLAVGNVTGWRAATPLNSYMQKYWDENASKYSSYFPDFAKPTEPSQYELLRLMTMDMNEKASKAGQDDSVESLTARGIALNNILTLKSLEKQDYIMILLATQLGNDINPINRNSMEAERNRFSSDKSIR